MRTSDLRELERIFPKTTPGKWKLWATQIMADQDGSSNVATAKHVADFSAPRTWDADMCCILQRNMPAILADARALWAVRVLWAASAKNHHISQPYPKDGGWTMLDTRNPGLHERDTFHVGATPEACCIAAATALVAADPGLDPDGAK